MRTTVQSNIVALKADLDDRIMAYNNKKSEDDPSKQVKALPLLDEDKLNAHMLKFCQDGIDKAPDMSI